MEVPSEKLQKSRSYGINDIMQWKFKESGLPLDWLAHLGQLPSKFSIYVEGDAGQGKTEYLIQLSKALSIYVGKTHLNNVEQGKHQQIRDSCIRNKFQDIPAGKFIYSSIHDFDEYKRKLHATNSGRNQIIDSISFWPLNQDQIQDLFKHKKSRNKNFILVGYKAHHAKNKPIAHMCDLKIDVNNFIATTNGRYGGTTPWNIWPDRPRYNQNPNIPGLFDMQK